ncbi:MAG: hypothetical protein LBQ52_05450 [Helicobacteraceae bacterium]|jgi:hypothetical protein|nr:hypothetical protein [Helicobacteraceae bacterium]
MIRVAAANALKNGISEGQSRTQKENEENMAHKEIQLCVVPKWLATRLTSERIVKTGNDAVFVAYKMFAFKHPDCITQLDVARKVLSEQPLKSDV